MRTIDRISQIADRIRDLRLRHHGDPWEVAKVKKWEKELHDLWDIRRAELAGIWSADELLWRIRSRESYIPKALYFRAIRYRY